MLYAASKNNTMAAIESILEHKIMMKIEADTCQELIDQFSNLEARDQKASNTRDSLRLGFAKPRKQMRRPK